MFLIFSSVPLCFAEEAKMERRKGKGKWDVELHLEPNQSKKSWMMATSGGSMGKNL